MSEEKKDELRVVIQVKGNKATIGIQAPDCDPLFFQAEGNLADIMVAATGFVEDAQEKWKTAPRYPKCETPAPAPEPTAAAGTAAAPRRVGTPAPAKKSLKPQMF